MQLHQKLTRVFSRINTYIAYAGIPVIILGVLVLVLLAAILNESLRSTSERAALQYSMQNGNVNFKSAVTFWENKVKTEGPKAAAEDFARTAYTIDSEMQSHLLAHSFGTALYETERADGLLYCPFEFNQGCAHQFIGESIENEGPDVIGRLFDTCRSSGTAPACRHSVGHGVMGYFGYTRKGLDQAISLCGTYDEGSRGGCLVGAFMEYNVRFLATPQDNGQFSTRPFSVADPYSPCLSVGSAYRTSCAFELPRWWFNVGVTDIMTTDEQRFVRLGELCGNIPDRLSRPCFEGVGLLASMEGEDIPKTLALCNLAGASPLERVFCIAGVVLHMHFWDMPRYANVCDDAGLTGEYLRYCRDYATTDVERVDSVRLPQ